MPRTGRGRTLTKPQRGKVWKVFEQYRSALKDKGKHEWLQVIQETRRYLEKKKRDPAVPGRRRGREPGLPPRGVEADPGAGARRGQRPVPRRGRPPADLRPQGGAEGLRHRDPGPVEQAEDQLPHDRADPDLGDGAAAGRRGGRPRRRAGRGEGLQVAPVRPDARGAPLRHGRGGEEVPGRDGQGTAQAQAAPRRSAWWPAPPSC